MQGVGFLMPIAVNVKFLGSRELERKLAKLEAKVQRSIVRKALRRIAATVKPLMEAAIPIDTGLLKSQGLRLRAAKRSRTNLGVNIMTPSRKELGISSDSPYYYPAHVEFGHNSPLTGKVHAVSYIRAVMDRVRETKIKELGHEVGRAIEQEARR